MGSEMCIRDSDVVFIGKVEDISEPFILDSDDGLYQVLVGVKLSLIRSFKGEAGKEITIFTRSTSAACGYTFKKGIEYAVFSHSLKNSVDNRLFVSGCGSTIHTDKRDNPYERERIQVLEYLESK